MQLHSVAQMIETVVAGLGLDPERSRLATQSPLRRLSSVQDQTIHGWALMKGSAQVFVFLAAGERSGSIEIISPVMQPPSEAAALLALYQRVLTLNASMFSGVAFALQQQTLLVAARRTTVDLDHSEVREMILRVGHCADLYDDALVAEFGGKRYVDASA